MTVIRLLKLLNNNLNLLLLCSLALACVVFVFTRSLPETYQSKTEIYTGIASGPTVTALGAPRVDYMTTSNEFDNLIYIIKSEQTLGEVGDKLLTRHLLMLAAEDDETELMLNEASVDFLNTHLPPKARDTLVVAGSETMTLRNIQKLHANYKSWTSRNLFDNSQSAYSYSTLSNLSVRRIRNSDLIEIKYSYTDPYICQQSLEILNEVFAKNLLEIKVGQSEDIVRYFRDQVEEARLDLQNAEETLKDFRISNKLINYEQQTRNIAGMQSQLESQYQEELRAKAAAESKVQQLESSMALNKKMLEFNDDLLEKRKRLASLNAEIAKLEVLNDNEEQLRERRRQAKVLEAELSNNLSQRFQHSKTKEGVNTESIIQKWLTATLELDATKARLGVLANRSSYVEDAYSQFSPLGSELGRLERAVGIAEKKYLELNNSLNAALTRQQSESISTAGIVVTVPPKLPLVAVKSKQMLLVLLAAVIGFLVPMMFLLILEFLDTTIRTPIRGEELTGLKLLGAYPDLTPKSEYKNVNMGWLKGKAVGHIIQNLRLETRKLEISGVRPKSILVFSTRDDEGKNLVTHTMAGELVKLDKSVLVIHPEDGEMDEENRSYDEYTYSSNHDFLKVTSLNQLLPEGIDINAYSFVLFEIKGVISEPYPIELMEKMDMAICVASAKRSWNKADRFALAEFIETLKFKPRLLVNAVEPDFMDSVLGEIEKSRSTLRKFFKAMLTLQFKSKINKKENRKKAKVVEG